MQENNSDLLFLKKIFIISQKTQKPQVQSLSYKIRYIALLQILSHFINSGVIILLNFGTRIIGIQCHLIQKIENIIQMKSDYSIRCESCRQFYNNTLALDCSHSICIPCLSEVLLKFQAEEMLRDEIQIECAACSYLTSLAIPLIYKLVRPLVKWENGPHELDSKMLVCLDCNDRCFPLQQYLGGRHQSHHVETIAKASSNIKNMLIYASKSLRQNINSLQIQNEKLLHCKSTLNDVFNANLLKIKVGFQDIKQQIAKKQLQVIQMYEESIGHKFKLIDLDVAELMIKVERGRQHISWINQNVINKQMVALDSAQYIQLKGYIINNHYELTELCNIQQEYHYKLPKYIELLRIQQNNTNLDIREILKQIERFAVLNQNLAFQKTQSPLSLSKEYFDVKRHQLLGQKYNKFLFSSNNSTTNSRAEIKIKNIQQALSKKTNSNKKSRSNYLLF